MVTAILVAGMIQSIVLSVFLMKKSQEQGLFWWLAVIHLCFAFDLSLLLAWHEHWLTSRLNMMWPVLYPVIFFLFIRQCVSGKPVAWRDGIHFTPFLVMTLLCVDLLWSPADIQPVMRHYLAAVLLVVFYLGYAVAGMRLIWRYQSQQMLFQAQLSQANLAVLWSICFSLLLAVAMVVPQALFNTQLPLPHLAISLILFVITSCLLMHPGLLQFEVMTEPEQEEFSQKELSQKEIEQPDELMKAISHDILALMDERQFFLNAEISLSSLAQELGVKPYLLTQALNQVLGIKFYDLVNERRIAHVCELLLKRPSRPVLEMAFEAGFNSKSTFNAAFKKYQQCTPSQYKARLNRPN
ncbi:helix-turn-helix domain-containing protein [Photobacterium galatheae]|uniref:AraC family transcriptional regulator n=1 Tax=Photobacterium galatheae TaxID=1654360 RepID=UPI00202CC0FD|nr:helix-turn-helix domain-containing protein [Photobacterium galatheae]MCM0148788.1 helix-turn-helix domain-containing protein [Photobacterium galatheae]